MTTPTAHPGRGREVRDEMVDMADKVDPSAGDPTQPFEAVPDADRPAPGRGAGRSGPDPDATAARAPIDETRLDATPVPRDGADTAPLGAGAAGLRARCIEGSVTAASAFEAARPPHCP